MDGCGLWVGCNCGGDVGCELWVKWGYGGDEIVIGVWVFFFFFSFPVLLVASAFVGCVVVVAAL